MDLPLAIVSAAAGNLSRTRHTEESVSPPRIVVFKNKLLNRLLIASVFVMVLCVLGLSCQIGTVIQSKQFVTAALGTILFIWTLILMLLNAKWIIILSRNSVEIVKIGKTIVGMCQALCFLSLAISVILTVAEIHRGGSRPSELHWSSFVLVVNYSFSTATFFVTFTCVLRGKKKVHQVIASWLWSLIHQGQLLRPHMIFDERTSEHIRDYMLSNYNSEAYFFSAGAA